jgi:hypothetical protein
MLAPVLAPAAAAAAAAAVLLLAPALLLQPHVLSAAPLQAA